MTLDFFILLVGATLASVATRFLPIVFASKKELSNEFKEWMNFIPVTIFAALAASEIFFVDGTVNLNPLSNPYIIPSIIVGFVSYKFKNMLLSIVVGVVAILITQIW